ncbi:hypothetical protein GCM10012285_49840 [Streptomyces kronopolitis]|uniref:Uncharacterized protein n=1 Tax=Streptomyces kronopolitis TaxID=1612435 RepID=A0ABQ2JVE4_9ACTN|nr:hypothetical protein [Streptomyces kronopolitis]GGN55775.1 hypothetical protein GCM10012285_49840 [Streptomyces kronopolitis]
MTAAGIALACWLVFGASQEWEGEVRLLRMALGLVATAAISGGARLIFWEPRADAAEPGGAETGGRAGQR